MNEVTPEYIANLSPESATMFQIEQILQLSQNEPNDVLRVYALSWLRLNAVQLLKRTMGATHA